MPDPAKQDPPELAHHLPLLLRHYCALSPSSPIQIPSPPFPSPRTLSLPQTQQYLVEHFLGRTESDEGARSWRRAFWRRVTKGIEAGFEERRREGDAERVEDEEVHPDILESMVDFLSTSSSTAECDAPGVSTRTYYWGDLSEPPASWRSIRSKEEGRMISGGTTGLRTWQACIALSNHLLANPAAVLSANRILELGAGVGLLSLVAARIKQDALAEGGTEEKKRIVATDVDKKVLEMLRGNIALNSLDDLVKAESLDWELASDPETGQDTLQAWKDAVFDGGGGAELIIGADIVYDPSLAGHLAATLQWLLQRGSGGKAPEALIAGTVRSEETWALFLEECRSSQLVVEAVPLQTLPDQSGLVGAEGWEGEGEVRLVRIVAA
ncbi:hypothetical protein JCM10049v2_002102 [Rhodotorula toruloides]